MSADEKPTVELEKPPTWAISLSEKVNTGFQAVNARLTGIETNQEIQGDTVRDLAKRMTAQEERANKQDERLANTSQRVREPSAHDLETAKALADEIAARTALAAKVDTIDVKTDAQTEILNRLEKGAAKLAANPIVRSIAVMLGTAALTWLAAHGGVK